VARAKSFDAELILGHKGVTAVIVPFDPEAAWAQKPARLAGRRHGWLVTGDVGGAPFEGYIGERWGKFFITVDEELRAAAKLAVGDVVTVRVAPTTSAAVHARAIAQSKLTTQPKTARRDAVALD
jgi:hypothetical protein